MRFNILEVRSEGEYEIGNYLKCMISNIVYLIRYSTNNSYDNSFVFYLMEGLCANIYGKNISEILAVPVILDYLSKYYHFRNRKCLKWIGVDNYHNRF